MLAQNFAGPILPVNPKRREIQGLPAYQSVADLPETPDVAIVAVPGELAVQAVDDLGKRGVKAVIVFTAGFAETSDGAAAQDRLVGHARAHGMRLLGPNCLGLFNSRIGFYPMFTTSFEGGFPRAGRIGIASQSGAYGTHLYAEARDRRMGTPICVTTGNQADVTLGDVIGWMAEDPDTDVIAAYAEGIDESERFLAALEAARQARKPVVMMKVGRSALGREAAKSHTASIAGDDAVTDAVLAEFGVVRAQTTEQLLDIAQTATRRVYPARNTLGVITISGGAGVLISDAAESLGLSMPQLPAEAQERLKELIPFASPINPVDCTAQVFNDMSMIGRFADVMLDEGGYASVLAFFSSVGASSSIGPELRVQLRTSMETPQGPALRSERARARRAGGGIRARRFRRVPRSDAGRRRDPRHGPVRRGIRARERRAPPDVPPLTMPELTPTEAEAKRLLAEAGIESAPERVCASEEDAVQAAEWFGYPVVLKILSPDILHKSEIGGVLLGLAMPRTCVPDTRRCCNARGTRRPARESRACWSQSSCRAASSASSASTATRCSDLSRCSALAAFSWKS